MRGRFTASLLSIVFKRVLKGLAYGKKKMEKTAFLRLLKEEGFKADMSSGVPTVHASSKEILKQVKKFAKECRYDSSFSVKFDGEGSAEEIEDFSEDITEGSAELAEDVSEDTDIPDTNKPDKESEEIAQVIEEPSDPNGGFDIFNWNLE